MISNFSAAQEHTTTESGVIAENACPNRRSDRHPGLQEDVSGAMPNLEALIAQIGSVEFGVRMEVMAALCGAGRTTQQALEAGLDHAQWRVRWRCLELLGHIADESAMERIGKSLQDKSVRVRRAALHAILSMECHSVAARETVARLLIGCALSDASVSVRRRAIHGLGCQPYHTGIAEALETVVEAEGDTNLSRIARRALEQHRRKAVTTGGTVNAKRNAPLLEARALLNLSPDEPLPFLATLPERSLVELLGAHERHIRNEANGVLLQRGQTVLDTLAAGMRHPNVLVRRGCANLMDHLADDRCVEPLFHALRDEDVHVRRGALHSLTCAPCKPTPLHADIIPALIERAMTDSNLRVRQVAVGALGDHISDPRVVAALAAIVERESNAVLVRRAQSALRQAATPAGTEKCAAR